LAMTTTTSTIRKKARIHDKANDKYLDVIEFPLSGSGAKTIELLPSVVSDLAAFEKNLRDGGAVLPKDDNERKQLLQAVAKSDAPVQWVYEAQTGWTEDRKAFVMLDGVIGDTSTDIKGVKRRNDVADLSGRLSTSGTVDAWRETVGKVSRHSTVMMTAISTALGAPLLGLINCPSFTISLFGKTRSGKTVATLAAGSVIGLARDTDLINWNITDTRLEQRLPEFNDMVFPIDDLMMMRGHDKDKYQRIRQLAYKITSGWSTGRDESYTARHDGAHRAWRCIALTSNEKSVPHLARAAKLERQGGEAVRLIDVPALGEGQDHIFDRPPADLDKNDIVTWKKAMFADIAKACEENHGQPWRVYVKALIAKRKLKEYVEKRIKFFEGSACNDFDGAVARDVARKFGVLYAGGMLGIECCLLPWEKKELLRAIKHVYRRARDLLPDDGILLRSGIAALREKLRQLPDLKPDLDYDKVDGYKQQEQEANRYVIKRDAYNTIFSSAEQQALVTSWLMGKQRVTLSMPKQSGRPAEPTPQAQFTWPDGERRRSVEVIWPLKEPRAVKKEKSKNNKKKQPKKSAPKKKNH
jgi:hypothetical protein